MTLTYLIITLITLFVLIFWWFFGREKIGHRFPNPLLKKHSSLPISLRLLWGVRVCIFLLVALLWYDREIPIEIRTRESGGNNIMLILDISKSMKTDDIQPSRLDKAKEVIDTFLTQDRIDRVGFTLFAGKTFVMSPLSEDREGLRALVSRTTTDTIDQSEPDASGTNIGDALIAWSETLKKSNNGNKIILLITDGRANMGIPPLIAAEEAKKHDITIYTIGIGSASGSVLSYFEWGQRRYFYDKEGKKVLADIDEVTLGEIAKVTSGRYFHADSPRLLEAVFGEIDTLVSSPVTYTTSTKNVEINPYVVVSLLVFMLLHMMIARWIRRRYK